MEMVRKNTQDGGKSVHEAMAAWNGLLLLGTAHSRQKFSDNGGQDASDGSWSRKGKGGATSGRTVNMGSLDSVYRQRVVMQRGPREPVSAFREATWETRFSQETACWSWCQNKHILVTFFKIIQLTFTSSLLSWSAIIICQRTPLLLHEGRTYSRLHMLTCSH